MELLCNQLKHQSEQMICGRRGRGLNSPRRTMDLEQMNPSAGGRLLPLRMALKGLGDEPRCHFFFCAGRPPTLAPCTLEQFKCTNGHCVPLPYVCDHNDNCGDRTDELGCSKLVIKKIKITAGLASWNVAPKMSPWMQILATTATVRRNGASSSAPT